MSDVAHEGKVKAWCTVCRRHFYHDPCGLKQRWRCDSPAHKPRPGRKVKNPTPPRLRPKPKTPKVRIKHTPRPPPLRLVKDEPPLDLYPPQDQSNFRRLLLGLDPVWLKERKDRL